MSNIIFYFTGTGNSLAAARDMAEKIGDTKIVSMAEAVKEGNIDLPYERIGFAFPVYYSCVPAIVKQFIGKLNFSSSQYIFSVVTFGGAYGMALAQLSKYIAERRGFLNAGFPVRMPGNYIDKYNAFPEALQRMLFKRAKKRINSISALVKKKESTNIPKGNILLRIFEGYDNKILADFGNMAENFYTTDKCNGCRTCEKVCPVGNIEVVDKKPKWGSNCEHCVACIQWCPAHAIEYADKTANRRRYQNPEIKVSDLILKSIKD